MGKRRMGRSDHARLLVLLFSPWLLLVGYCDCQEQGPRSFFPVSSFSFPNKELGPYDWSYARVELPPWFSSMTMKFVSNIDLDSNRVNKLHKSVMPIMCFRHGGPPLPDVSDMSLAYLPLKFALNGSLGGEKNLQSVDWCLPFQRNITVTFTNEQMSPGVWYVGFFNGLGPARTQSKMITRGRKYTFSTTLSIEGCSMSTIWGPYCNQTITPFSCSLPDIYRHTRKLLDDMMYRSSDYRSEHTRHFSGHKKRRLTFEGVNRVSYLDQLPTDGKSVLCNDSVEAQCLGYGDMRFYSLDVVDPTSRFEIVVEQVKPVGTAPVNSSVNGARILLLGYARYNAMPNKEIYDFSSVISDTPLVVQLPEIGRWYLGVRVVNRTEVNGDIREAYFNTSLCFSVRWKVQVCPPGKAGPSCAGLLQSLQIFYFPSRSYYLPLGLSSKSAKFHLEPFLSNYTVNARSGIAWTYLLLEIPQGAAGSNLHVQLVSDATVDYEVYTKFGGIPSDDNWDHYANNTSGGNGSMILMSSSNEHMIDFYILYVREGPWGLGIKKNNSHHELQTMMSITLESCPRSCSSHGSCRSSVDETGFSSYSFCDCDRDHGGFDCSNELVSHQGHVWQSICLIGSNAAALFPAFWALRQKAFAEWVLFTASGVSSGLYHACDVGTWCALPFHVLQFMDFWLSFMAVVSTFVFLASVGEGPKRTIHMCVSIVTAILAATGATRPANIVIVVAIGAAGLLFGWILKLPKNRTGVSSLCGCGLNVRERWRSRGTLLSDLLRALRRRFRWGFILMGFLSLGAAGGSWMLENHESYWIWHSLWHVTIYTSSFFFLCSVRGDDGDCGEAEYELTQEESSRFPATEEQR